jgi:hypothetical protein
VAIAFVVTGVGPLRSSATKFVRSRLTAIALAVATAGVTLSLGTTVAVAAPANDDRSSPQVIGNPPSPVSGDTSQATADPSDPIPQCSGSPLAGTLWYSWTPAASGDVRVNLHPGAGTVPIAAFYTSDGAGNLTRHACTTGGQATFQFAGGQTYLIMVGQYSGCCSPGPFTLTLTPSGTQPPPNDVRSSPQVIENPPYPVAGDTFLATADPSDPTPSCSGSALAGTLWYSWTPAASGDVGVKLQGGAGTSPVAAFYTSDGGGNLTQHACRTAGQSTVQFTGGQTFLQMVGQSTGCCSGTFTLTLTPPGAGAPANDVRSHPQVIGNPPFPVAGDTSQATADASDPTPSCSGSRLAGTLWYSWTPADSGDARVDLQAGAGTVPIAAFYTSDGAGNLTQHACTGGGQSTFGFARGQTYLIMVGQYTGCCSPGPFTLTLTPPAAPPGGELTLTGFFAPIDMDGILNTVKAGAIVPLKFRVFDADVEQTDVSIVAGFTTESVDCTSGTGVDAVEELATTSGTTLRYDPIEQQFVRNWKSPKKSGCYAVTMTTVDGSSITALFKLK